MDRRYPSTTSALGGLGGSSIRHRSGAYSPSFADEQVRKRPPHRYSGSCYDELQHTPRTEVAAQPTITLVRAGRETPVTPTLPTFTRTNTLDVPLWDETLLSPIPRQTHCSPRTPDAGYHAYLTTHLSPVPLTPRPQRAREDSICSIDTMRTTGSRTSRLPTPNFPERAGNAVRSYFPRLLSFMSNRTSEVETAVARPQNVRNKSSCYSTESGGSTAVSRTSERSIMIPRVQDVHAEPHRPALLPSFSTTDKFTKKFPRPRSVKNLTYNGGQKGALAATMLEEGEGLGIGRVDRWTIHKWCLLLSVTTVLVYGLAGLICAVLTWFRTYEQAGVMYVADNDILILITLSSSILLLCFLVGISGTILNSRPILAVYAILLWPAFLSIVVIGYTAYKRYAFALDRKLNFAWSQWYTPLGRLIVQDALRCCGFYDALHEATASKQCYPRTPLLGCKGKLYRFERENLATVWAAAFALVPVHIANIFVSLLCANHVTRTFGKGIMPRRYWLSNADLTADAERLKEAFASARPVTRPSLARPPISSVFREDREERETLLNERDCLSTSRDGSVGLGLEGNFRHR